MSNPLVTLGVPVYRGQDRLPGLLECLRTQSYKDIDVLISVDAADEASADACKPFLGRDSRFRMHVQPERLGWAGNTDWTMCHRRGDFYVYQQHDDLLSPTYIADLVEAAGRFPDAAICFAKVQYTGQRTRERTCPSLVGDPIDRVLGYLRRLDWVPFRGLIRGSALDKTAGLLLSDFDPFDSLGTEMRLMAQLSLLGEFRFVAGPTYFKSVHGENLSGKRKGWSMGHRITATAWWAAWMIEVIAPAGQSLAERRRLFRITLERFAIQEGRLKWIRPVLHSRSVIAAPLRVLWDQIKRSDKLATAIRELAHPKSAYSNTFSPEQRKVLRREIFERLKSGGRFDPRECLDRSWEELASEILTL